MHIIRLVVEMLCLCLHLNHQDGLTANCHPQSQVISLRLCIFELQIFTLPKTSVWCESWTIKKAESQRIDAFELWYWRRLLRVPWTARCQAFLSITSSQSLLKLMSIEPVMPSNRLILCCPLLLPPSIFPNIRAFPVSKLFASGSQSIGVSASASVLPMNIQDWFPLGWTGWISLQFKGFSRVFSNTIVEKHQFFGTQLSSQSNSHTHTWLLEKS